MNHAAPIINGHHVRFIPSPKPPARYSVWKDDGTKLVLMGTASCAEARDRLVAALGDGACWTEGEK